MLCYLPPSAAAAAAMVLPGTRVLVVGSFELASQWTADKNGFLNDEFRAASITDSNILNGFFVVLAMGNKEQKQQFVKFVQNKSKKRLMRLVNAHLKMPIRSENTKIIAVNVLNDNCIWRIHWNIVKIKFQF